MSAAIVVLNAGSSSIKFSHFVESGGGLELALRGQIERRGTRPRFFARQPDGTQGVEKSLDADTTLGRVVHGGLEYSQPVRVDGNVLRVLDRFITLPPCTSQTTWRLSAPVCWKTPRGWCPPTRNS